MSTALIFYGGWDGHQPAECAELFAKELEAQGVKVTLSDSLNALNDPEKVKRYDLIVPIWTMGEISKEQSDNLLNAVKAGTGLAGFHGGMGDAFRGNIDYEWAVGGIFVGHPHIGDYTVRLTETQHEITEGLPLEFPYNSEQYYMLTDPGNNVLADTLYDHDGRRAVMPVVWTRSLGRGRVFFSALGHQVQEFRDFPQVKEMTVKGLLWAMR
ncbi:ThuA domain-containing protein [Kiritimatiellaeota bacterium B1221]|nr:ThuA domain-containing protein [Kiritimatiellaeota bacterium B1221]